MQKYIRKNITCNIAYFEIVNDGEIGTINQVILVKLILVTQNGFIHTKAINN